MDLKSKLRSGGLPVLGSFVGISSPPLIEMLGYAGYDFAILDAEHGVFGPEGIEACLRAARAASVPCIVRVAHLESRLIQSALDSGAGGVQIPQVETASQAAAAVEFSRFPPDGKRGWGSTTTFAAYGFTPRPVALENAQRELVVSIQIESKLGVENLSSILAIDGFDVVFIGTSDLSLDFGYQSPNDPRMFPLVDSLVETIVSAGKIPGIHVSDWSKIPHFHRLGVNYFTVSAGLVMKDAFTAQVKDFGAQLSASG